MAALGAALDRGPVALVCGPRGVGKTALALETLARRAPPADGAMLVSLRGVDRHEPLPLVVARSLARAERLERIDWSELLADADALTALAIDAAETLPRTVLLDDIDDADVDEARALLSCVARYARRSRWIVTTSRRLAVEELAGQVVELGALAAPDLRRLAAALHPEWDEAAIDEALASSDGSPRELRRCAAGIAKTAPPPGEPRPPDVVELVAALTGAPAPLSCEALDAALDAHPEPSSHLEAVRALVEAGDVAHAAALLDRTGSSLLDAGHAAALLGLLPDADGPLHRFRLEAALALGDARSLDAVREPHDDAPRTRLAWARVLLTKGQLREAAAIALELSGRADVRAAPPLAFAVGTLRAQALLNGGEPRLAIAVLDALAPSGSEETALRDALAASAFALSDDGDRAAERARAIAALLPSIDWPLRGRIGLSVTRTLYSLGDLRGAASVLDDVMADRESGSIRFDAGRVARFMRLCIAIDAGDLERAEAGFADLAPYVGRGSLLFPFVVVGRVQTAIGRGAFADIDAELDQLGAVPQPAHVAHEIAILRTRLRLLRREPPIDEPDESEARSRRTIFDRAGDLYRLEHRLRLGDLDPAAVAAATEPRSRHPELAIFARTLRSEAKLLEGDAAAAFAEASAAVAEARSRGFLLRAVDALALETDAAIALGRREAVLRGAAELARLAEEASSSRFATLARMYEALVALGTERVARLESLALASSAAPDAAARARALLGEDPVRDRIDAVVLAAIERHFGWRQPSLVRDAEGSAWGLDRSARAAWLPDGTCVDFSRHPVQWALLDALAHHGGAVEKERLVLDVWRARDYHPLRDDNRLHAAVRKLRRQIEADPSAPRRVVTTETGYALGGRVRIVG